MSSENTVLRAMLRLARRREAAGDEALAVRVGASPGEVRAALRRLDAAGLVERRDGRPPRLTLSGFAVAVGLLRTPAHPSARSWRRASRAA